MIPGLGDHLTQESGTASQRDPSELDEWASKNLMMFSRSMCEVLHLGYKIPTKQHKMGTDWPVVTLQKRSWMS